MWLWYLAKMSIKCTFKISGILWDRGTRQGKYCFEIDHYTKSYNMEALKRISLFSLAVFCGFVASAQSDAALQTFTNQYPDAQKVQWEQESETWKAEFWMNGQKGEATYTQNGVWIGSEIEIGAAELPAVILKGLERDFPGHQLLEAEVISGPKETWYEVDLQIEGKQKEIAYNVRGHQLPSKMDDHDTDDIR